MEKTRVLLSVEQQLHSQLLKHTIATCSDLELIGEATDVIRCMMLIAAQKPHVWIHSWDEGPELAALQSHIYCVCPNLSIIRISPNEPSGYIQLQVNSMSALLKLASQSHQWGKAA